MPITSTRTSKIAQPSGPAASTSPAVAEAAPTPPAAPTTSATSAAAPPSLASLRAIGNTAVERRLVDTVLSAGVPQAERAHPALQRFVANERFATLDATAQLQRVRRTLDKARPDVVSLDTADDLPARRAVRVVGEEVVPVFNFHVRHHSKVPARKVTLRCHGYDIPVFLPVDGRFGKNGELTNHSVKQIAKALASLSPRSASCLTGVVLSPVPNPTDASWGKQYGIDDFRSYMTCGADGEITIYPQPETASDGTLAVSMMHELGHQWSLAAWGSEPTSPEWKAWKAAAKADGVNVSNYGAINHDEDVAESSALYESTRHDPTRSAHYRNLFPNRFAILDAMLADDTQARP